MATRKSAPHTDRDMRSIALALALVACSHAEPSRSSSEPRPLPAPSPAPSEPVLQAGNEEEEPPPDPAALANGRALALPGPNAFLSTWRLLHEGPLANEASLGAPCEECDARVVAFDDEVMDLGDLTRASTLYLGATLLVPRETVLHVMLGMRGGASVLLDGRPIASGASEDRFRADRVLASLPLAAGERRLVVRFDRPAQGQWRGAVRVLGADHRPGAADVAFALGALDEARAQALAAQAVRFDEHRELGDEEPVVRVRAHLPGGGLRRPIAVGIGETESTLVPDGRLHAEAHELRVPMPSRGALRIEAAAGERTFTLGARLFSDRRALEAASLLRSLLERAPESARAPIAWRMDELLRAVRERDSDQRWRDTLRADAQRIARAIERGRAPFERVRGYERMAFFSRLDGTAQEYELFVPPAYRPDGRRTWPLLVTLHGYSGNAGDYFRNTFGLARDYENGESLLAHGRHGTPPTRGPMFVIGPTGRGQSYYRHAGEIDVLEAIEDVRRRFPGIDPDRIYITGGSMGGTGAAYLPYRHPDLFAASAALAGYHDQRVREDTSHEGLSDVERFLQAHRSDIDWAENGLHLPMLLVRGLQDRPLEWTRCLARRLNELGYRCEHREPDLGHNVWTETYADGAIFDWLGRYRRPSAPAHVRLRTARERTREAWWVRIDEREAVDRFASVDARIEEGAVVATIEHARAVTFSPAPPLVPGGPLRVRVGDALIEGPAPLTIEKTERGWRRATQAYPRPNTRRPGLDGPIRSIFHEPLTFVIGTQDPDHTFLNRLVAEHWAHPPGWIIDYPIVDDVDVTDAMIRERALVLVGPPSSNSILARIADRLPIRFTDGAIALGDALHRGPNVGAAFVAPNPLSPERLVLVIAGPTPLGTWRSLSLPDILPDYVVYDERVAPARDRWSCGGTGCEYRAHGFFDLEWRLR